MSPSEARRTLGEIETLVASPGWAALRASLEASQRGIHSQLVHQSTSNDRRGSLAGEWRAYENMLSLPQRTMMRLQAIIDDNHQGESDG